MEQNSGRAREGHEIRLRARTPGRGKTQVGRRRRQSAENIGAKHESQSFAPVGFVNFRFSHGLRRGSGLFAFFAVARPFGQVLHFGGVDLDLAGFRQAVTQAGDKQSE
jgi:hypothetical protein